MGQEDVYKILKNNPEEWYTTKKLHEELINIGMGSIGQSIRRMEKAKEIIIKKEKGKTRYIKKFKYKK
ncbi:MAG: hypothetical protein ACOCP8_01205 [archaeon]